jgi:hypothetical protein
VKEAFDGDALNAERHRRRWHDRDDVDAGDVIAGVVLLGAIAAIASSGKRDRDRDQDRDYDYDYDADRDKDVDGVAYQVPTQEGTYTSRGIDRAVDMCVDEVQRRETRVSTVDSATRGPDGWHVSGDLENGQHYLCAIGNDGQISDVFVGDNGVAATDGQYDDAYYTSARASQGNPGDDGRYDASNSPDFEE